MPNLRLVRQRNTSLSRDADEIIPPFRTTGLRCDYIGNDVVHGIGRRNFEGGRLLRYILWSLDVRLAAIMGRSIPGTADLGSSRKNPCCKDDAEELTRCDGRWS